MKTEKHIWRFPTIKELSGTIDYCKQHPATSLPDTESDCYWSQSHRMCETIRNRVWCVNFEEGSITPHYKMDDHYVRGITECNGETIWGPTSPKKMSFGEAAVWIKHLNDYTPED